MRNEMIEAWSAAQSLGSHLAKIEDFLRADDRLGALEYVREARADLGRVALAMSDVWQETHPRPPAWMSCPTCSGPTRETTNLVCQTCGTDYGADHEAGSES